MHTHDSAKLTLPAVKSPASAAVKSTTSRSHRTLRPARGSQVNATPSKQVWKELKLDIPNVEKEQE